MKEKLLKFIRDKREALMRKVIFLQEHNFDHEASFYRRVDEYIRDFQFEIESVNEEEFKIRRFAPFNVIVDNATAARQLNLQTDQVVQVEDVVVSKKDGCEYYCVKDHANFRHFIAKIMFRDVT